MITQRFVEPEGPKYFYSDVLDYLLGIGWYRMKSKMFTTNFIITEEEGFLDVYWMRIHLGKFQLSKSQKTILLNANQFSVEVSEELFISIEMEELFLKYKRSINFNIVDSITDSLYDETTYNDSFDSRMVTIRDGDKLIAFGIFDAGKTSMAGIISVYDPAYSKYSLGKVLILHKIQYAIDTGREYFYPGYITKVASKFSYKQTFCPDAIEILDPDVWISFNVWNNNP